MENWEDEEYCLKMVKEYGFSIQFIKNPSLEVQLEAVKRSGNNILFIIDPCFEVIYQALETDPKLPIRLIKISEEKWNEFKEEFPELFI